MTRNKIILLLLAGLLTSCFDDGDCRSTKTDLLLVDFKSFETKMDTTIKIESITLGSNDSLFHKGASISSAILPLDPNFDTLRLTFNYADTTLQMLVGYTVTPRLISVGCGVELSYSGINSEEHNFDSVVVRSSILDEQIISNIVIYQ